MELDKRVAGLAAVSVILSTLIVLTTAGEKIDKTIEILKNKYEEESMEATCSFALVTRKKFENVQIRFSVMSQITLKRAEMVDPEKKYNASDSPDDMLDNMAKLSWLRNQTAFMGIEPERFSHTFQFEGVDYRMTIHDYSNLVASMFGREVALAVPLIFGAIIDENGEAYYLTGNSDFFFNPEDNIISLRISRNTDEYNYVRDDQIWEGPNCLPISEAPKGGMLDYESVKRDDTLSVSFTAGFRSMPPTAGKGISRIQMIKIYLDGEIFDQPIINVVR